jgi:hypothetical protein
MWTCPECGRSFANRNQSHFCSHVRLEEHFKGRGPNVLATLERLLAAVEAWLAEAYSVGEQKHLSKQVQTSGSES